MNLTILPPAMDKIAEQTWLFKLVTAIRVAEEKTLEFKTC